MYFADCKKDSLFLNCTPYFHNSKKLLLNFEFYPLFSRAGGKLLFWKNPSEGSAISSHRVTFQTYAQPANESERLH